MRRLTRHGLPAAVVALAMLCAVAGCNGGPAEDAEPPSEPGTWKPGGLARVAILADGRFRVQQETTADVQAVAGLLKKAGAVTAEPVVIDAAVLAGSDPVLKLKAVLKEAGFAMTLRQIGQDKSTPEEKFQGGFLYWAAEQGFDASDAVVVLTGEVEALDSREDPSGWPASPNPGERAVIRIREFLRIDRQAGRHVAPEKWIDPAKHKWLSAGGAEGLWPGDKLVVRMTEYDGGLGILPQTGGDCRLGVKLSGWEDPVLESIRYAVAEGMEKALAHAVHGQVLRRIGAVVPEDTEPGD
jgi:hypothetical protein